MKSRLLGVGASGVDFIAHVDKYPQKDDKIRTVFSLLSGGGNCANTLCAVGKLLSTTNSGKSTTILSVVGADANGQKVLSDLNDYGVDSRICLCKEDTCTAFTYVLVEKASATRTCIHTPITTELNPQTIIDIFVTNPPTSKMLQDVLLIHSDSRHTAAAYLLARLGKSLGIPVTIDAEKDRPPYFTPLLQLSDIVFTNEKFPQIYTVESSPLRSLNITGVHCAR